MIDDSIWLKTWGEGFGVTALASASRSERAESG